MERESGLLSILRGDDSYVGGVIGARDAAFAGLRGTVDAATPSPETKEELARRVAAQLRAGRRPFHLAAEHRSDLERLGLLREDSQPETAIRRFQEFLRTNVYGKLIPVEELPARVRAGLAAAERRRRTPDVRPSSIT